MPPEPAANPVATARHVPTGSEADAAGRSAMLSGTGMSGLGGAAGGRQVFAADELAIVLSHYGLGVIEAIQEFPRGSRKAPKLILRTEKGVFLLKRRARGKDDPYKVAFCHKIQLHLAARQFPLPHLIGTRRKNNSMLKWNDCTYELFEYVKGNAYDQSLDATAEAGKVLSLFHKLLRDCEVDYPPSRGSYHASRPVMNSSNAIPATLRRVEPEADDQDIDRLTQFVGESYAAAAKRVDEQGLAGWPKSIVHSDWHPGNMIYHGSRVVAVIDYDAARIQQRVVDVANAALQFSITAGDEDPATWPDYLDESRFKRFIRGYDAVPDGVLSRAEVQVLPDLMIEALIAEAVIPIAATGSFGRMSGPAFLGMVERKIRWIQHNAEALICAVED